MRAETFFAHFPGISLSVLRTLLTFTFKKVQQKLHKLESLLVSLTVVVSHNVHAVLLHV